MSANGAATRIYDRAFWRNGAGMVLSLILIAPIRVYQRLVSPLTPPSCRYRPCCSAYAARALRVHGPFKGLALGTWRLVRCNPWSGGGIDPVPSRGRWLPDVHPNGRPRSTQLHDTTASPGTPAPTSPPGA